MPEIAILALPNVLDSSLALCTDILDAANRVARARGRGDLFATTVWAPGGRPVRTARGQRVVVAPRLGRPRVVIVPGQDQTDVAALLADVRARARVVGPVLRRAAARGAVVAASCSAVFHVAAAGLLRGRTVTTAWFLANRLRAELPETVVADTSTLVRDGRVWTAGAALSIIDLALAVVRQFGGAAIERDVARYLVLDKHPTQARYAMTAHFAAEDPVVARAEAWVRAHVAAAFGIPELARAVGTSARSLARRLRRQVGMPPIRFVQRVRAEVAAHLLETSDATVDEVAGRVGYRDASTLRRILRRELDRGARELRRAAAR